MNIFINECSLHSQFHTQQDFTGAVRIFYSIVNRLAKYRGRSHFYKNSDLFCSYSALKEDVFARSLSSIPDKSLKTALKNTLFNKETVRDWTCEQHHLSSEVFECNGDIVTDTSMAELAERKLGDGGLISTLLNFRESRFANCEAVTVIKEGEHEVNLDCVESVETLEKWLDRHSLDNQYRDSAQEPPMDYQTILDNRLRFEKSSLPRQGGRQVFVEKDSGYFWYVDNLHFGKAAHLEVFDRSFNHIGEAGIDGIICFEKADKEKKLGV